ncbi:MAG: GHKL domain-containing protein, partial [Natronohydrobacter sp.]|nr:GHKL domain-containing protein [Natronohydrobacter sp.]
RLTRISRHLRNFARKPNQQLRAVALNESITEAQELLGWRLRKTGVTLDIDLGATPLQVVAGPVRLQQVLVNLISNAIDAVEGLEDKRLHLRAQAVGTRVQVSLRDHGPGVADGLQARIFDPFFSTKEVGKGLGLGLSISYNIMRDFGGSLSVENHPQGGAVFTLDLQSAAASAEAAE